MAKTAERSAGGLADAVAELAELGLVESADVWIRVQSSAPLFKIYLINGEDLFFGFYPVIEHTVSIDGEPVPIFDPMGKDTELFHHAADNDPDSIGTLYVHEAAKWFESIWDTISRPYAA